jgi:hypothetical protein
VQIVAGQITVAELSAMAEATFGDLVKAVADVRRGLLEIDAGMHSDLEALLLDAGPARPTPGASTSTQLTTGLRTSSTSTR